MTVEQEVLAAAAEVVDAFGRHDVAAYFESFAADATFVFHTQPGRLESRADYERLWARWEAEDGFHVLSCSSSQQRVQDLGAVAVFTHAVRTVVRISGDEETVEERETIVFRREGTRWLAVHEHLSAAAEIG